MSRMVLPLGEVRRTQHHKLEIDMSTKVEAGQGYRLLEPHELIEASDETWNFGEEWISTDFPGRRADWASKHGGPIYYRRKVEPTEIVFVGGGYRQVMPGELLLQGDMFCLPGINHWLATVRYGSVLAAGDGTYRRKIEQDAGYVGLYEGDVIQEGDQQREILKADEWVDCDLMIGHTLFPWHARDYRRRVEPVLTYPEIPEGYRLLVEGEEPQRGDEYAGPSYSSWYLIFDTWTLADAKTSNKIFARKIKQVLIANHYDELSICPDHEIPAGSRRVALNEKGEVIPCTP